MQKNSRNAKLAKIAISVWIAKKNLRRLYRMQRKRRLQRMQRIRRMQSIQNFKRCEARKKANDEGIAKNAETVSKAKIERVEIV